MKAPRLDPLLSCSHCARTVRTSESDGHTEKMHPDQLVNFRPAPKRPYRPRKRKEIPGQMTMFGETGS